MLDQAKALARYNRWMNEKLYSVAAKLTDAERKLDRGAFFGSIHGTLNHILLGDRIWMGRFTADRKRFASRDARGEEIAITALSQILYEDFGELTRERKATDAQILEWVSGLDDSFMTGDMHYANLAGAPQTHTTWWALLHLFNHQTHHRGQVTTLLMQAGQDPGATDLIQMLRTE